MSETSTQTAAGADDNYSVDADVFSAIATAIEELHGDMTVDLSLDIHGETSINTLSWGDSIEARSPDEGTLSDVTRMLRLVDYVVESDPDLTDSTMDAFLTAGCACSTVAENRDLTTCHYANCNGAAVKTDLTADWNGTRKEIDVCPDCYRGIDESEIPIDDKHTQRHPADPKVEGVDEVMAHRQDGMAGVYALRRDKAFLEQTL